MALIPESIANLRTAYVIENIKSLAIPAITSFISISSVWGYSEFPEETPLSLYSIPGKLRMSVTKSGIDKIIGRVRNWVEKWRDECENMRKTNPTLLIPKCPAALISFSTQTVRVLQDNRRSPVNPSSEDDIRDKNGDTSISTVCLCRVSKRMLGAYRIGI